MKSRKTAEIIPSFDARIQLHLHNLANVHTPGYRVILDWISSRPTGDFNQGKLQGSNRALDVAINGYGFFKVALPGVTMPILGTVVW